MYTSNLTSPNGADKVVIANIKRNSNASLYATYIPIYTVVLENCYKR